MAEACSTRPATNSTVPTWITSIPRPTSSAPGISAFSGASACGSRYDTPSQIRKYGTAAPDAISTPAKPSSLRAQRATATTAMTLITAAIRTRAAGTGRATRVTPPLQATL